MRKEKHTPFTVADDYVEVIRPFAKAPAIAFTFFFLALGPLHYLGPASFADLSAWNWALLAGGFLSWLYFLAGVRTTTRFDFDARNITRRNLFGIARTVAFDDVASITLVEVNDSLGRQGCFYQLARRSNLYGKGVRLTARYRSDDPHLLFFYERVLPCLNFGIFGDAGGPTALPEEIEALDGLPPASPVYYKRKGTVYYHSRLTRVFFILAAGLALFAGGMSVANSHGGLFVLLCFAGLLCPFLTLSFHWRIAFDLESDVCIITMPFFVWRNRLPINRYLTMIASRTTIRRTYFGTWLYLEGIDKKGRLKKYILEVAWLRTPGLSQAGIETQQILDSTLNRAILRKNRKGADLLPRVRRPYLQVTHHDEYA